MTQLLLNPLVKLNTLGFFEILIETDFLSTKNKETNGISCYNPKLTSSRWLSHVFILNMVLILLEQKCIVTAFCSSIICSFNRVIWYYSCLKKWSVTIGINQASIEHILFLYPHMLHQMLATFANIILIFWLSLTFIDQIQIKIILIFQFLNQILIKKISNCTKRPDVIFNINLRVNFNNSLLVWCNTIATFSFHIWLE